MYNRYLRSDPGGYAPIPEEHPPSSAPPPPPPPPDPPPEPPPPPERGDFLTHGLQSLLRRFHLESVDSGDLLLVLLLFLLHEEDADEELLFALGLLLIL